MKNKILIILSLLMLVSCRSILKTMYRIKDPGIENEQTIIKKALKFGLDTSNIVTVSKKDYINILSSINTNFPEAAIYDRNGKYIEYRKTDTSCNAGLFTFIPELNLTDKYNQPDSANLQTQLNSFRDLKGNKIQEPGPADFYLLLYWAVWQGKLNKDHIKVWEDLAHENKNCNIKVIKVNMDFQEYWGPDFINELGLKDIKIEN